MPTVQEFAKNALSAQLDYKTDLAQKNRAHYLGRFADLLEDFTGQKVTPDEFAIQLDGIWFTLVLRVSYYPDTWATVASRIQEENYGVCLCAIGADDWDGEYKLHAVPVLSAWELGVLLTGHDYDFAGYPVPDSMETVALRLLPDVFPEPKPRASTVESRMVVALGDYVRQIVDEAVNG
jgi:hypothetical protein